MAVEYKKIAYYLDMSIADSALQSSLDAGVSSEDIFDFDTNGDIQPAVSEGVDAYYEYDVNSDIMPKAA